MSALQFRVLHAAPGASARRGVIETPHGVIDTPAFVTVGTQASVKGVTPEELRDVGAQALLANTYHLYLRPGPRLVAELGGLHRFMAWDGPLMTDSGGYQVFSLGFGLEHGIGKLVGMFPDESDYGPLTASGGLRTGSPRQRRIGQRPRLTRVDDQGVTFTSHIDGSRHRLTPELSIEIQEQLGADIILSFDEPTSPLNDEDYTLQALERTHRWATQCLEVRSRDDQALYGIVQGGAFRELRKRSANFIAGLPFDGFAIGGSLGRSKRDMERVLEWSVPVLPAEAPRHMLGIGEPEDLFACVARGIDTFDCVAPTRHARHGIVYTASGKLNLQQARYRDSDLPIEAGCLCYACQHFSRAYVHHLFRAQELLAYTLTSVHNLQAILGLMARIRSAIEQDELEALQTAVLEAYRGRRPEAEPWSVPNEDRQAIG